MTDVMKSAEELDKFRAEAEAARELAARQRGLTYYEYLQAEMAEMDLERARHTHQIDLVSDFMSGLYVFNGEVSGASVGNCIARLMAWQRVDKQLGNEPRDVEVLFNSPGGSVTPGFALFDTILSVRRAGHHVTTSTFGYAASMAGILLQAGDHRVIGRESYIMIHEASSIVSGKVSEMEDRAEWFKIMERRVLGIFAERSTLTEDEIRDRTRRREWWLDSDEALALGFVDEVR